MLLEELLLQLFRKVLVLLPDFTTLVIPSNTQNLSCVMLVKDVRIRIKVGHTDFIVGDTRMSFFDFSVPLLAV